MPPTPREMAGHELIASSVQRCKPLMTTPTQVKAWYDKPEARKSIYIPEGMSPEDEARLRSITIRDKANAVHELEENAIRLVAAIFIPDPRSAANSVRAAAEDFFSDDNMAKIFPSFTGPIDRLKHVRQELETRYFALRPDLAMTGPDSCELRARKFINDVTLSVFQVSKELQNSDKGR